MREGALLRPVASVGNLAHRLAFLATIAMVGAAGCVDSAVRTAPFRVRPDAPEAGALAGPFTGRVVDSTTHAPVAGALVYGAWTLERGTALPEPAGAREFVGSTDANGAYSIPELGSMPRGARVTEFTLLVYKRGYIAYRSDRRFADLGPRMDFAQEGNQVLLERWRTDLSHARHLRFVGGGTAVAALTQWELADASAELDGKRGTGGQELRPGRGVGPYIVAAQLLSEGDIKARTKYDGGFETGPLSDEPDTAAYSSQHFKALGRPETWDVALRLWRLEGPQAEDRYEELLGSLPDAVQKDDIASKSFIATEKLPTGEVIRGVGFLDAARGLVVLLTCGQDQCSSPEDVAALGATVYGKIKALVPAPGGRP